MLIPSKYKDSIRGWAGVAEKEISPVQTVEAFRLDSQKIIQGQLFHKKRPFSVASRFIEPKTFHLI